MADIVVSLRVGLPDKKSRIWCKTLTSKYHHCKGEPSSVDSAPKYGSSLRWESPDVKAKPPIATPFHPTVVVPANNWLVKIWRDTPSIFLFPGAHSQDSDGLCLPLFPLHDTFLTFERAGPDFLSACEGEADAGMTKVWWCWRFQGCSAN